VWFVGIAWDERGFEAAGRDSDGRILPSARFRGDEAVRIAEYVVSACGPAAMVVVDSTNGLLDGPLRAHGLTVFRADPWHLPSRPAASRSVTAAELAGAGLEWLERGLAPTSDADGTLAGRHPEMLAHFELSAATVAALSSAGRYLRRAAVAGRRVALTFDDGPTRPFTHRVLDILRECDGVATFFCVGLHAEADPGTLARIAEAGHCVGNHTWSHPFVPDLAAADLLFQLDATNRVIERATGARPALFRPPYGIQTPESLRLTADQEMTTVVWDVDTRDWARPGPDAIRATVRDGAGEGSIVLMHDGGGDRGETVAALPGLIEGLLADGFELVTVADLLPGGAAP
jgi:peptidoglycan/xylan/chitin deacetylase (PgdA/CDA1 family)